MHSGQAQWKRKGGRRFGLSLAALLVLMTVTKLASRLCAPLEAPSLLFFFLFYSTVLLLLLGLRLLCCLNAVAHLCKAFLML